MPQFAYSARSASGEKIDGVLDAGDTNALAELLSAQGLMLLRAEARTATNAAAGGLFARLFGERIKLVDLILFCRQLATLLKAGVPLLRSLRGLEESATNRRFAQVLADLQQQLESGRQLSASMKQQPAVFTNYMVSTVKVGEVTGRLSEAFQGLYTQLSFERENREAVAAALRYPSFVLAIAAAALIAVNIFVIPAFANVYRTFKADLPPITLLLIAVSDFIIHFGWLMAALGIVAAIGFVAWLRTPGGLRFWHSFLLRLPIVGALIHKATLARFAKSFGLALKAGVPVVDALNVAVETSGNVVIGERIATMGLAAERGESLARAARNTGVFTPTVLQMFAVGEETGALDEMMTEVAEHFQKEVDYAIKSLGAQIEPIMILVLGAMILVFALGVFLPMWDLSRVAIK
ncbi:MAG TPA: type II secretion system F family protein [Burkholderiaceae bacterium]|nr:type II secretion system F family protein [Burkholderiaceae bacterium]